MKGGFFVFIAKEWVKVLDDNPYPKVKNYKEERKKDLRQWIAKKLKEQKWKMSLFSRIVYNIGLIALGIILGLLFVIILDFIGRLGEWQS